MKSEEVAFHLACVEARARHQIEGYAGQLAALTANYGHEFSHDSICSWANVNHAEVPEHLRAHCEENLYGFFWPRPV